MPPCRHDSILVGRLLLLWYPCRHGSMEGIIVIIIWFIAVPLVGHSGNGTAMVRSSPTIESVSAKNISSSSRNTTTDRMIRRWCPTIILRIPSRRIVPSPRTSLLCLEALLRMYEFRSCCRSFHSSSYTCYCCCCHYSHINRLFFVGKGSSRRNMR